MATQILDETDPEVDPGDEGGAGTLGEDTGAANWNDALAQTREGATPGDDEGAAAAGAIDTAGAATQTVEDDGMTIPELLAAEGFGHAGAAGDDTASLYALIESHRALEQQARAYEQRQQAWAFQFAQLQSQLQQLQRGQQQAQFAPQQAPAQAQVQGWNPPEWDPKMLAMLDFDEQGNPTPKPYADPRLPGQFLAFREHWQNVQHQLATKPQDFFSRFGFVTQQQVDQRVAELVGQQFAQQQAQSELAAIKATHGSWLYQHDASGRVLNDPGSGQPLLTPEGVDVDLRFRQLVSQGLPHGKAFEMAVAPLQAALWRQQASAGQQTTQAQPPAPQQDKRREFLRGAARMPGRGGNNGGGTRRAAAAPPNADFMDLAREDAQLLGIPLN